MASKVLKMKMWPDEAGGTVCTKKTSRAKCFVVRRLNTQKGKPYFSNLIREVSQFTLMASTKKGNKPDFHGAAGGEQARELYENFYAKVQELYDPSKVKNGVFQAMMEEIETNSTKGQYKDKAQGTMDAKDDKLGNRSENFQIPKELLE
ncbi:MAG: hypothetical protein Q9217_001605 [Psora testacea]